MWLYMLYGLKTTENKIIYKSRYLQDVLTEMKKHNNAYIVEIEEKIPKKRNYSEEFLS